jgi:hypothetical protein
MLIIALQFWEKDFADAMRLASRLAELEDTPRADVEVWLVPRFDAPAPTREVLAKVATRFNVNVYRTKRRGRGFPAGPNDMVHDVWMEVHRRCLQERGFKERVNGVLLWEADDVPVCKDWLDRLLAEWKTARQEGKLILGCKMDSPVPHINGNMIFHPSLFASIRGLEGCPTVHAWDIFHAEKFLPVAFESKLIANFYHAKEVPPSRVWNKKGATKYAFVHGVKDGSIFDEALKRA